MFEDTHTKESPRDDHETDPCWSRGRRLWFRLLGLTALERFNFYAKVYNELDGRYPSD